MTEPRSDRVRVSGPLSVFAEGYSVDLAEQGYLPASARAHLGLLGQLSRWMADVGLVVDVLSPSSVERFLTERRHRGYVSSLSLAKLRPLLGYLERLGVVRVTAPVVGNEVDRLIIPGSTWRPDYLSPIRSLDLELRQIITRLSITTPIVDDVAKTVND